MGFFFPIINSKLDSSYISQNSPYFRTHEHYIQNALSTETMFYNDNPFPHIDTFWYLCSRQLLENIVTKEEIAQNEQFLLFATMFSTFSHKVIHSIIEIFHFLTKYVQSCLLQNCRMRERVKPIPHAGKFRDMYSLSEVFWKHCGSSRIDPCDHFSVC